MRKALYTILLLLCFSGLSFSETIPAKMHVLDAQKVEPDSGFVGWEFVVAFELSNDDYFFAVDSMVLDLKSPRNISFTIESPYEVCGDASWARVIYNASSLKPQSTDCFVSLSEDPARLNPVRIYLHDHQLEKKADALRMLKRLRLFLDREGGSEFHHQLTISEVVSDPNVVGTLGLVEFLAYPIYTHVFTDDSRQEITFQHQLSDLSKGIANVVDVHYDSEGRREKFVKQFRWYIIDGELYLEDETGQNRVELDLIPEEAETFEGQPTEVPFPTAALRIDDTVYISEALTSC